MANLKNTSDLKILIVLALLVASILIINNAFAQTSSEFGYRLIPSKIVENSKGILHVYPKAEIGIPEKIDSLVVTSSDSSIIKIDGIQENPDGGITSINISAVGSGTANIALAAPGFLSQEFEVTVYSNKHNPSKLLIKTTPDTFSLNGPKKGYVSVELTDKDDFPTKATEDMTISLSTSTSDVVSLKNNELVIKKDEYFAYAEFDVTHSGSTLIYASSPNMETVSSKVTLNEASEPLEVHLYVYPSKINSFSTSYAYAIVELQDSTGEPVIAENNIPISLKITDPNFQSVNTSEDTLGVKTGDVLEIKKGTYWGYAKIVSRSGLEGTYDVSISTKDYLVSDKASLDIVNLELLDTKFPTLDILPVLSTGRDELIGVLHLEDSSNNPVAAKENLQIKVDSSDENSLSVDDVKISKGFGSSLVFGKTGYSVPDSLTLTIAGEDDKSVDPVISGTTSQTLVVEPLISEILANTKFPSVVYLTGDNAESTYFSKDLELSIPPDEFVKIQPKLVKKGQSAILLESESMKQGSTTITIEGGDLTTSSIIESVSSKPAKVVLDYPESILSGFHNAFSIQLLDSEDVPVFTDHDMEIKIVSNDPTVITVPENVMIPAGGYYAVFDVDAKKAGDTELAILTSEIPLSKFDVSVTSISPEIVFTSLEYVNPNTDFDIALTAQYLGLPLDGLNVEWKVTGASIKNMDSITNENGMATISLHSEDPTKITIEASVSGGVYGLTTANKELNVNQPLESEPVATHENNLFSIGGINILFIIIPAAIGGTLVILKKKNMLDGITEKLNFGEKISEIKEKLSGIRGK
jgi:hypothetical protein